MNRRLDPLETHLLRVILTTPFFVRIVIVIFVLIIVIPSSFKVSGLSTATVRR